MFKNGQTKFGHNWSHSKCCKIFKACLTILGHYCKSPNINSPIYKSIIILTQKNGFFTFCFCLIPFFFLEIEITDVKNSKHKSGSVCNALPPCISPLKNAWDSLKALGLYSEFYDMLQMVNPWCPQTPKNNFSCRYNFLVLRTV